MEAPAPAPAVSPAPLPARKGKGSYEPDFSLCGGMGDACPLTKRDLCVDAQYLDCPPKSHCVRQSKWYWQCLPESVPAPAPHITTGRRLQAADTPTPSKFGQLPGPDITIPEKKTPWGDSGNSTKVSDYEMCGGTGPNCPLFKKQYCIDAQYLSCASSSSQCIRMNAEFWECLPNLYNGSSTTPPGVPQPTITPMPMQAPPPPAGNTGSSTQGGRRLAEDSQDSVIAKEGEVCGGWGPWCQSQYGPTACATNKQVVPCEENTRCILISGDIMQCIRFGT
ncbi:hypothetical protein WJX75_000374 [Coccomyxa subellipsoidea]|uniref:CBM1 domain-containing protein n=1 Tax=Coccomyxa subellipsoidea TaxID=248742 RepID=A0ABR2YKR6_9CHLO